MNGVGNRQAAKCLELDNVQVARQLDEVAELLELQGANAFRVRAYRNAARTVRQLPTQVRQIAQEKGASGLIELPGIGSAIAHGISQMLFTGTLPLLDQLHGAQSPERILRSAPYVGRTFAHRIHEQLGIETLAELETAAWDGRLTQVSGMGSKRISAIRDALGGRFRRRDPRFKIEPAQLTVDVPPVDELLEIDSDYRRLAELDRLPKIAPRRFNAEGKAWLPIFHTRRGDRHYTALYSNTARAHEFGATHDWVVIYRDDDGGHGQWTVITAGLGPLKGERIVRGREDECRTHYESAGMDPQCSDSKSRAPTGRRDALLATQFNRDPVDQSR